MKLQELFAFIAGINGPYAVLAPLLLLVRVFARGRKQQLNLWLEAMNVFAAITGVLLIISYVVSYCTATFHAAYDPLSWRITGPFYWLYTLSLFCIAILVQLFWFPRFRTSAVLTLCCALAPFIGERVVILLLTRYQSYLPSSFSYYLPTTCEVLVVIVCYAIAITAVYFILRQLRRRSCSSETL